MSSAAPTHITESIADRKKSRELAEARQNGAVAPQVDVKTGSMINPHNPEFITRRPWYLGGNDAGPSLDHQSNQKALAEKDLSLSASDAILREERIKLRKKIQSKKLTKGMWVEALKRNKKPYLMCQITGIKKNGKRVDLKFEDGYVETDVVVKNGGTPRIRFIRSGNRSHTVDHAVHGKETYASKRDAYHGYDIASSSHSAFLTEKFEKRDRLRKRRSAEQNETRGSKGGEAAEDRSAASNSDSDSDIDSDVGSDSDDEFVQRDEDATTFQSRLARQGGVGGAQMKVTARNLRIREDTAKYLRNLDLTSAYYDPKSRSMRDNPQPDLKEDEVPFVGDNFARKSGDAIKFAQNQVFAWEVQKKEEGVVDALHPQANPSQVELLNKEWKSKSEDMKMQQKKAVLDKYGGGEYLDGGDGLGAEAMKKKSSKITNRSVRFGVSVISEEYSRDGRPVNQQKHPKSTKSKYEEDVFHNGHNTVWGTYFHKGAFRWGYRDDHSLLKNSYCTGLNGQKANDESNNLRYGTGQSGSAKLIQAREMLKAIQPKGSLTNDPPNSKSSLYGEANKNKTYDETLISEALQKVQRAQTQVEVDDRKRKYNSLNVLEKDVTEEDMEAYRMLKGRGEDPMSKLAGDKLLDCS